MRRRANQHKPEVVAEATNRRLVYRGRIKAAAASALRKGVPLYGGEQDNETIPRGRKRACARGGDAALHSVDMGPAFPGSPEVLLAAFSGLDGIYGGWNGLVNPDGRNRVPSRMRSLGSSSVPRGDAPMHAM
jgi:hypothetical protein